MTSENDVLESIDKLYDQLFSKERQIADYIRANPQEVIMMNVSQLVKPVKPLLSAHVNILVIRDIIKCVLSSPVILAQNQMMPI